jgi:hypothetical protein
LPEDLAERHDDYLYGSQRDPVKRTD